MAEIKPLPALLGAEPIGVERGEEVGFVGGEAFQEGDATRKTEQAADQLLVAIRRGDHRALAHGGPGIGVGAAMSRQGVEGEIAQAEEQRVAMQDGQGLVAVQTMDGGQHQ